MSVEGIYICLFTSRTAVVFRNNMLRNSESNTHRIIIFMLINLQL